MANPKIEVAINDHNSMSDQFLRIIMNQSKQGILIVNSQGVIIDQNEKWNSLFKYLKSSTGLTLESILPGMIAEENRTTTYQLPKSNTVIKIRFEQVDLEADQFYRIYFVTKHTDKVVSLKQYQKIKDQKQTYEIILNSIEEAVFVIDKDGFIKFLNSAAEKLEGYLAKDVIDKNIRDVYAYDWNLSTQMEVFKKQKSIKNARITYPTQTKIVDVMANFYPIYFNGEISSSVSIYQDYRTYYNLVSKNVDLQKQLNRSYVSKKRPSHNQTHYTFKQLIGESDSLKMTMKNANNAAKTDSPILIYGETGTGKELFAQSIHHASDRSKGPFVAINCAAIPESLLEGILFGTSKGAYTDAVDNAGLFEQTNGGTIFLDEINSMALTLQAKLLRVVQEKKVRRLGQAAEVAIDVRIISSCNVEPNQAKELQQIRDDLFYRLAVVYLVIPPLRNRGQDVLILSDHFIQKYRSKFSKNVTSLHADVYKAFLDYDWPGNVRQLQHCIESAMNIVAIHASTIDPDHIPEYMGLFSQNSKSQWGQELRRTANDTPERESLALEKEPNMILKLENMEKELIITKLKAHRGNISITASEMGLSRQNLQYRLKKYDLQNLPTILRYSGVIANDSL